VAIDERVYDLFVAMGPDSLDALAWLLGHELAHYYQDHGWAGDFGNGFADLDVGRKMKALSNQRSKAIEIETQADYFGAFYGQVAGYRTLDVMPAALQRVYTEYELDPELTGYPALGERQEIARGAADQLRLLIPVFEVGNNMLLLGLYEEAGRCFDMIAEFFPSREILNNAGVARALEALELLEDEELLRFAYPLELDVDTRLRQVGGKAEEAGYEEGDYERRERLLREAQAIFEQARERDDSYVPAIVNLACVLDLRGEHEDAGYWARKAMRVARDQQDAAGLAHALIVRGISAAHLSPADTAAARNDFVAASDAAAPMAAYNLAALDGKAVAAETTAKRRPAEPETIAGLGADDYRTHWSSPRAARACRPGAGDNRP
jgi:tetratricopeptide (TPR) repeat protein